LHTVNSMRIAIVIVLGLLVSTLVMVANVLHYGIKRILRERGYPVSFWYGHFRDIRFLREVIDSEKDPFTKVRYQKVLYALVTAVILFLLSAGLFFQAIQ